MRKIVSCKFNMNLLIIKNPSFQDVEKILLYLRMQHPEILGIF